MFRRAGRLCIIFAFLATLPLLARAQGSGSSDAKNTDAPATPKPNPFLSIETEQNASSPVEVWTAEMLRDSGAHTLRDAIGLAAGIEVETGGDEGPAGSVISLRGIPFDGYLLVVDGIPWGDASRFATAGVSLSDVERIVIRRGPAPLRFGATSFGGVIEVIHRAAESSDNEAELQLGRFDSSGASISLSAPLARAWKSRLTLGGERNGFSDDRSALQRGHLLWRVADIGKTRRSAFDVDLSVLRQQPAGTTAVENGEPRIPADSNVNPAGAFLDIDRFTVSGNVAQPITRGGWWTTTLSLAHSSTRKFRGFLTAATPLEPSAIAFHDETSLNDLYADTRAAWQLPSGILIAAGAGFIHSSATSRTADTAYTVPAAGTPAAFEGALPAAGVERKQDFGGPYALAVWRINDRIAFTSGVRWQAVSQKFSEMEETQYRWSGEALGHFLIWRQQNDQLQLFAGYRDSARAQLPVTSPISSGLSDLPRGRDFTFGGKGSLHGGRMAFSLEGFRTNLFRLQADTAGGGIADARVQGFETSGSLLLRGDWTVRASYSVHQSVFGDSDDSDGRGFRFPYPDNRLPLTPRYLASAGVIRSPLTGIVAGASIRYSGDRFLDIANASLQASFAVIDLVAGYRWSGWNFRLNATNLGNRRDLIAQSAWAAGQYFRLASRRLEATLELHF